VVLKSLGQPIEKKPTAAKAAQLVSQENLPDAQAKPPGYSKFQSGLHGLQMPR